MNTNDQYLDCLCRTCLNEVEASSYGNKTTPTQQLQSIFHRIDECGALRIAEMLSTAVPQIQIQPSDDLPNKICHECLQQLLSAYRFQQMCVQSEEQMRQLISSTKQTDLKVSKEAAIKECELIKKDTAPNALETAHFSSTHQNLEHPFIQEAEAVQSSSLENSKKLLEACKDEGCFNEFIKNDPIKDHGATMYSTNSVLSVGFEEEQIIVTTDEVIQTEPAQSSDANHFEDVDQSLEDCKDSRGEFSKVIKNEPIEDDKHGIEYSDDETIHSIISVAKDEMMSTEPEEGQANLILPRYSHEKKKSDLCRKKYSTHSNAGRHLRITYSIDEPNTESILMQHTCTSCDGNHGATMYSTNSVLSVGFEEEQIIVTTDEVIQTEPAQSSDANHFEDVDQSLEDCKDSRGEFSKVIKNEPIEDDKHGIEYSDDETIHSIISVAKDEMMSTEPEEGQANLILRRSDGDKPYECPYCPLRFRRSSNAKRHKKIHEGDEREACDICGKNVKRGNLKRHKLIHIDEKLHKCDICEMRFIHPHTLRYHKRTHTGENPYKCKYCEFGCTTKTLLNAHLRNHLGNNVFRCEFCPLAFPLASKLRSHFITHKNEDPETRERNMKALSDKEDKLKQQMYELHTMEGELNSRWEKIRSNNWR